MWTKYFAITFNVAALFVIGMIVGSDFKSGLTNELMLGGPILFCGVILFTLPLMMRILWWHAARQDKYVKPRSGIFVLVVSMIAFFGSLVIYAFELMQASHSRSMFVYAISIIVCFLGVSLSLLKTTHEEE